MMAETERGLDAVSRQLPSYTTSPLEHSRLVEELRASRLRVVQAAERERRRLERDLHDGAQQLLVEIQVRLGFARTLVDSGDLASELDALQEAAQAALD